MIKKYNKLFLVFLLTTLLFSLCGCSVSYRDPEQMTSVSSTTEAAKSTTGNSSTAEQSTEAIDLPDNPQQEISDTLHNILKDEEFSSMKLDSLDCSESADNTSLYDITLNITWTIDNYGAIAKSFANKHSNAISVKVAADLPYVNTLTICYTLPYLNNGKASISYKKNGSYLNLINTTFDENFNDDTEN